MAEKSISVFFKDLGFPLNNSRWSWGAHGRLGVLLRTWSDEVDVLERHVKVLGPEAEILANKSAGLPERIDHLRILWAGGLAGYVVMATARDVSAATRDIQNYERDAVQEIVALLQAPDGSIWAELGDLVAVSKLAKHAAKHRVASADGAFPIRQMAKRKDDSRGQEDQPAYLLKLPAFRDFLITVARDRRKVTYAAARQPSDFKSLEFFHAMDRIGHQCLAAGEPVLTSLIVDEGTGRCSAGFAKEFKRDDELERQECYDFWSDKNSGSPDASSASQSLGRDESPPGENPGPSLTEMALRFASVAVRPEQAAFRRRVFMEHGGACFVTGCRVVPALDAAHRQGRDWRQGHNRGQDGLLLRKDIHALYDAKLVSVGVDGAVDFDESVADHYRQYSRSATQSE
jgi:hypothetical protein